MDYAAHTGGALQSKPLPIFVKAYWKTVGEANFFHQIWVQKKHYNIISWYF